MSLAPEGAQPKWTGLMTNPTAPLHTADHLVVGSRHELDRIVRQLTNLASYVRTP